MGKKIKARTYGWLPDVPDPSRDYMFGARLKAAPTLPPMVDLRPGCSAVEEQGWLGSCTAQALVGALEFLEMKSGQPYKELSRLFVYYNERVRIHSVEFDSGAMLRDGIKSLAAQGVCEEPCWPYEPRIFTKKPHARCYQLATQHRIGIYMRITTGSVDEMMICLATGYPFVFGVPIYESFESEEVAKTGVIPMPQQKERMLGGHAMMCVGYTTVNGTLYFIIRNSWSERWGLKGYCLIPATYMRDCAEDLWVIKR